MSSDMKTPFRPMTVPEELAALGKRKPSADHVPVAEGDRPSIADASGGHKVKREVTEALGRLVEPLDKILGLMGQHAKNQQDLLGMMEKNAALQKKVSWTAAVCTAMLLFSLGYLVLLSTRMSTIENKLVNVEKSGAVAESKVGEVDRKLDEAKYRSAEAEKKLQQEAAITLMKIASEGTPITVEVVGKDEDASSRIIATTEPASVPKAPEDGQLKPAITSAATATVRTAATTSASYR